MTTETRRRSTRPRVVRTVVAALCGLVLLAAGLALRPGPSRLPGTAAGDPELATVARELAGEEHRALAVAVVTPDGTRTASLGAEGAARFEAGSISKGVTGLLLAEAVTRGEVRARTTVGELLPELADVPLGAVTLEQLATHRSGLPVQPSTPSQLGRNLWFTVSGTNPYAESEAELLTVLRDVPLDAEPGTYSNLGFDLLGAALAAAAGQEYPELVTERVLSPLGMEASVFPLRPEELTDVDLVGETAAGRTVAPWLGGGMAPAGGLRAPVGDMARLAGALADGSAPGIGATEPVADLGEDRIGWAWITSEVDGRTVTWHNGGTGGFASFLGWDADAGTAVVVLSSTAGSVDAAGMELLARAGETR